MDCSPCNEKIGYTAFWIARHTTKKIGYKMDPNFISLCKHNKNFLIDYDNFLSESLVRLKMYSLQHKVGKRSVVELTKLIDKRMSNIRQIFLELQVNSKLIYKTIDERRERVKLNTQDIKKKIDIVKIKIIKKSFIFNINKNIPIIPFVHNLNYLYQVPEITRLVEIYKEDPPPKTAKRPKLAYHHLNIRKMFESNITRESAAVIKDILEATMLKWHNPNEVVDTQMEIFFNSVLQCLVNYYGSGGLIVYNKPFKNRDAFTKESVIDKINILLQYGPLLRHKLTPFDE